MPQIHQPKVEPLWGAVPDFLEPISEDWAVGFVAAKTSKERSTQPRWGIWDLRTGKVALAISGAVAIGFSRDQKQIGVWRERLEATPGRPFFDGNARADYRWSFERRRWPAHKRVISEIDLAGDEHAWFWPAGVEFADDDSYVVLTCKSADKTAEIIIECRERGGDRVVATRPKGSRAKRLVKKIIKKVRNTVKKAKAVAKTKTKTKTKTKAKTKATAKTKAKTKRARR